MMICGVCLLQDPGPKSSQVAERRVTGASAWGIRYPHRYGILSFSLQSRRLEVVAEQVGIRNTGCLALRASTWGMADCDVLSLFC